MGDFDPIRALHEEINGLSDVAKIIHSRARESERVLAESEANHNANLKLDAFMKGILEMHRVKLRALEEAAERKAKGETQ